MNGAAPLSLAAGSMLDIDPSTFVAAAAAAGFGSIGLRVTHQHALTRGLRPLFRRQLDHHGIVVHDVEVHRIGTDDPDAARHLVDLAADIGAARVLVVSDLAATADGHAATAAHLARIVDHAAGSGVRVGLEYMAWTTPRRSGDAADLALATGATVVVDVLHHTRLGEGIEQLQALVTSGAMGWVQVCDAPADPPADLLIEARHHRLPPGDGGLPLRRLLAIVPDHTTRSVEVQCDDLVHLTAHERAALLHRAALDGGHPANTTG